MSGFTHWWQAVMWRPVTHTDTALAWWVLWGLAGVGGLVVGLVLMVAGLWMWAERGGG